MKLQFAKEHGRFHNLSPRKDTPPPEQGFDPERAAAGTGLRGAAF